MVNVVCDHYVTQMVGGQTVRSERFLVLASVRELEDPKHVNNNDSIQSVVCYTDVAIPIAANKARFLVQWFVAIVLDFLNQFVIIYVSCYEGTLFAVQTDQQVTRWSKC